MLCAVAPDVFADRLDPLDERPAPDFSKPTVRGAVLDLCTLGETPDPTRSVKQRGVVLGLAGLHRFDADAKLASIGASDHARETFVSRFPLDRLYGVVSALPGRAGWLEREVIGVADVQAAIAEATVARSFAGNVPDAEARERAFVSRSLPCTDWLFVPVVDQVSVLWRWQPVEMRSVGATASSSGVGAGAQIQRRHMYLPDLQVSIRVGVFHRSDGDFKRVRVVRGGSASDMGMPDQPPRLELGMPKHISAIPDPSSADGTAASGMLFSGKNEFSDVVCKSRTMWNPDVWALCAVRLRTEKATGGAQLRVRKIPELTLFADMREGNVKDKRGPGIAIGRHEGVKVGYGFYSKTPDGKMKSFYKVTKVGPGGPGGDSRRTALRSRFGHADPGERVFEYPQSNIYLGVSLGGGSLGRMSGPTTFTTGSLAGQTITFPTWTAGASVSFMWDYSAVSRIPESRSGAEIHFLTGVTESVSVLAIPIDFPKFEQGFYLGPRTKLFASVALTGGWLYVALHDSARADAFNVSLSGKTLRGYLIGGAATVGLEYMSTPDRLYRFDIAARTHSPVELDTDDDTAELATREDRFASITARLSVEFGL